MNWKDAVNQVFSAENMAKFRTNCELSLDAERRMAEAGIPVPPRAPILTEAYRVLGLLKNLD